jgi:long-subunit acyl-CoA synthetase (AMP-forming)
MKSDETIFGSRMYCDYKIVNSELVIRGNISVYGYAWFPTGDLVKEKNGTLYYLGRK